MSRQTTISLVGVAAIGVGLLSLSASTSAAPVNGASIGKAASAEELTQKVIWRGRAVAWRGVGWRPGWRRGLGWRGVGWRAGWGWRPGLAAAGVAATGLAAAAAYNNYGYGNYGYRAYGPGAYTAAPSYGYGYGSATPSYGYTAPSYGYTVAQNYNYGYGNPYGYGTYYGGYSQPGVSAAAAVGAPTTPAPAVRTATTHNRRGNRAESSRWTRGFCVNAVHERLGVSSADAGKDANRDAVIRCMERGPMAIG
jgi:hypothetical protein